MLKVALFDEVSMKTATVWIEDGAFALFFRPHRRGVLGSSSVPVPGILTSKAKKNANAREGLGAVGFRHHTDEQLRYRYFVCPH